MTGFELDRRIREILLNARPETVLSSTAALCELGFGTWQSFLIVEKVITTPEEKRHGNETHDTSAHPELPREAPQSDCLADQPGHQEVRRPGILGARQGRQGAPGQGRTRQGSQRRPGVRRVQGVRQYLLAHSFNYEVDVTHHNTDAYQVPKPVSKKLWIVPERVAFEEVQEQVMRGAIVSHHLPKGSPMIISWRQDL
jgi:hypothetical protein